MRPFLAYWQRSLMPGAVGHLHQPVAGSKTRVAGLHDCRKACPSQQLTNLWCEKWGGKFEFHRWRHSEIDSAWQLSTNLWLSLSMGLTGLTRRLMWTGRRS